MMSPELSLRVRVARKTVEAVGISSFELVSLDGRPLPAFSAGSHIDVSLPGNLTRQYSLCNSSAESHRYLIAVLKDPSSRGGSKAMHELVEGESLTISPPKNHFELARDSTHSLLLAGGIGVTPLLCMAERLSVAGASFEFHYCTRSRDRMAFRERILGSDFSSRAAFHFDDGEPKQRLQLEVLLSRPQSGVHVYVCGPKGFMDAVLSKARESGWSEDQLHYEFFGAPVLESAADASFDVKLVSSGKVVRVDKGRTVVQALADAGVEVQTSCEQGVCGTCLTRVLEGVPDHRDMYLTPTEQAANDRFLPCCSRAKSSILLLDL